VVSTEAQIKLAIVSSYMIDKKVPLDSLAERLRDNFGVDLSDRQIAAIFAYWRKLGANIKKERYNYRESGYTRARAIYTIDAKSIKRLLDTLYEVLLTSEPSR